MGINVARLYGGVTDVTWRGVAWRGVRGVCCSARHGASAPGVRTALTRGGARRPVAPQPRARRPPHGRRSRCLEPRRVESDRVRFLVWGLTCRALAPRGQETGSVWLPPLRCIQLEARPSTSRLGDSAWEQGSLASVWTVGSGC